MRTSGAGRAGASSCVGVVVRVLRARRRNTVALPVPARLGTVTRGGAGRALARGRHALVAGRAGASTVGRIGVAALGAHPCHVAVGIDEPAGGRDAVARRGGASGVGGEAVHAGEAGRPGRVVFARVVCTKRARPAQIRGLAVVTGRHQPIAGPGEALCVCVGWWMECAQQSAVALLDRTGEGRGASCRLRRGTRSCCCSNACRVRACAHRCDGLGARSRGRGAGRAVASQALRVGLAATRAPLAGAADITGAFGA